MNYFDKHATGGFNASKVDQQDVVAIYGALRLIADGSFLGVRDELCTLIEFEHSEDLHIIDSHQQIALSVKSSELPKGKFRDEVERLDSLVKSKRFLLRFSFR